MSKHPNIWFAVYDNAGAGDPPAGDAPPPPPPAPSKMFTQEELNKILAEDKKKWEQNNQKLVDELKAIQQKATLTAQERAALSDRLEKIQSEMLSKEELARREKEKLQREAEAKEKTLQGELNSWRTRYNDELIMRGLLDASSDPEHPAISPEPIAAMLRPLASVTEEIGADGQPTGRYVAKVKFTDVDKSGAPVTLDLSPKEAVKRMSEQEKYFHLFKGKGVGGSGSGNTGGGKPQDLAALAKDQEAYRKAKAEGRVNLGRK